MLITNQTKHLDLVDIPVIPPFFNSSRRENVVWPRLHGSKRLLLAAISALSMTPFAVEAWTLDFSPNSYSVDEAAGSVQVGVSLNQDVSDTGYGCTITGTVVASGGTATSGSDYSIPNGNFSFTAVSTSPGFSGSTSVTVNIVDDTLTEANETIALALQGVSTVCGGDSVSSRGTASVTITDNDTERTTTTTPTTTTTTPNLTLDPNFTPNQQSVYDGLTSACAGATGELLTRCNQITNADLDAIIPSQVAAQGVQAADFGFKQFSIIHGRIVGLRNAQQNSSALLGYSTINLNGETIPVGKALAAALGPALGSAAGDDSTQDPFRDSPLGFFIKGQFNVGNRSRTANEQGFDVDRKSMTLGIDYSFTDNLMVGAAFGYGGTDTTYTGGSGRMETDAYEFSSYGSYFLPEDFYVDWILSYALHNFDLQRNIHLSSNLATTAQSSPNGDQYGLSLGFGKDFAIRDVVLNPYLRYEYINTQVDGYAETGGAGLGLEVDSQTVESMSSTIGGQATKNISMPWGILTPGIRFEWVHQYMHDNRLIQARFSQASAGTGFFTVRTDNPDRDYFNLGGSMAVNLPEGRAGFLRYEYRLGQSYISDHTVELGARIPF